MNPKYSLSVILLCLGTLDLHSADLTPVFITDFSVCTPTAALSKRQARDKWRLVSYATEDLEGTMLTAASFIEAPPVTLPLGREGWYAIHLAVWNPEFSYDGTPMVKVRSWPPSTDATVTGVSLPCFVGMVGL